MKALVVTVEPPWPLSRHWHIVGPVTGVVESVRKQYGKIAIIDEYEWDGDAPNCGGCGEKLA